MDEMARQFENILNVDDLKTDFPGTRLKHAPHPAPGEPKPRSTTVSQDIEALKAKLMLIARGIEMLKEQL